MAGKLSSAVSGAVFEWGGGGEGLKDKQVMLPRKFLILTPLKCREMHSKLINEILKYKLSVLIKRHFYPMKIDKHLLSLNSLSFIDISFTVVLLILTLK